jgi:hypothetical protein
VESWEVAARESIRDLVARYNSNGDAGRFAQVMELFAPGATVELRDRTHVGHDDILTIFSGAQDRVRGDGPPEYVRHFTSTHQIDVLDSDRASGRLYFAVLTSAGLDHWGRYIDEYRLIDEKWRFARRRVIVDGQAPTSIFPPSI